MRILTIDASAESRAKTLKEFALARRYSLHDLHYLSEHPEESPGNDPNRRMGLEDGWIVIYTIEQHPRQWFHHVSISIDRREGDKAFPHPAGVEEILKMFGLGTIKQATHVWHEPSGPRTAVNLLFPFTEPPGQSVL